MWEYLALTKNIKHYLFLKVFHQVLFSFSRPFSWFYICLLPNMKKKKKKKKKNTNWEALNNILKNKKFLVTNLLWRFASSELSVIFAVNWKTVHTVKRANSASDVETSELQTPNHNTNSCCNYSIIK